MHPEAPPGRPTPHEDGNEPEHGTIAVATSPGHVRVELQGELDLAVAVAFRARLRDLLVAGHTEVVIDLSGVVFMDSSALGVLISAQRQTRMFRGSLTLANPSAPVRRLLALTSLDKVFDVDVDDAVGEQ